jgi:hypothetical protein
MKPTNSSRFAATIAAAALAVTLSAPANSAIVIGSENGWEVSYGGFVNLFMTVSDFEFVGGGNEDSFHLNEGLLPAFHTLTVKTPEIGGLRGTGQITFAPDSSGAKSKRLNKGGAEIDMREVFFNVEGDFGTISAGRTLALFQRQAILKDYTLFGMGALAGPDGGGTGLGRIGFGYVYPDFRTRFTYKTPTVNGFTLEVGIFDPQETAGVGLGPAGNIMETSTPQIQGEATYAHSFDGGNFNAWLGFVWQEADVRGANFIHSFGGTGSIESVGVNIGGEVNVGGFNVTGSWYTGDALGTLTFLDGLVAGSWGCSDNQCSEADNWGYYVQGAYTFNGKTKVGISYGETRQKGKFIPGAVTSYRIPRVENELWTVGVYHDVNSWLKVIAEYGRYQSNELGIDEADTFSLGGFLLW